MNQIQRAVFEIEYCALESGGKGVESRAHQLAVESSIHQLRGRVKGSTIKGSGQVAHQLGGRVKGSPIRAMSEGLTNKGSSQVLDN